MKIFWLLVLAIGLSGCATLGIVPPEVALVNLEFEDLTVFETTGAFTVRLSNENPDPLFITGGVFRLYLNGVRVGKGLSSEAVEIPRLGTTTQKVDLHINNLALATQLVSLMDQPTLSYRIKTKLFLERSFGTRKLVFEDAGTFSFDKANEDVLPLDLAEPLD